MTTENNKLIAEFMGLEKYHTSSKEYLKDKCIYSDDQLEYNTNWNWLMEVVIECKRKQSNVPKNLIGDIYDALHNTDIKAVLNACIEFIKWYNQNGAKEN